MATTVQDAIDMVRSVHPAFSRFMVPDKALADFFTREQRRLISLALLRDRSYLTQSLPILFDLLNADLDAVGTAGAGTDGGVPAESDGNGGYQAVQESTGSAVTVTDGTVSVSNTAVTSATATTLTGLAVSWTVNAYAGKIVRIVAGTGAGQSPRSVSSNTADTLTVSDDWETTPDTTSVFQVVQPVATLDETTGVVTDLPATSVARGFLVKLNASGTPYLDYTAPVVGHVSRGIPLPPFHAILGGTVRYVGADSQSDYAAETLWLVSEASRYNAARWPAAYLRGSQLHLIGQRADWQPVESIELSYVPVPPAFTARTDLFLLPDTALPCVAAKGAVFAASRISGIADVPQPPLAQLVADAAEAEAAYLTTISLSKRARIGRVRPGG